MRKIVDLDRETLAGRRFGVKKMADLINDAYLSTGREPSDRAKKSFAPSGIGYGSGTCPRQWFYAFEGGLVREEEADAPSIANMAYGTDAHTRLQYLFEKTGILVETERKVVTDDDPEFPPIFGFADLIINWQGEEAVGEIKTTTQESYVQKKAKGAGAGYHLLQVLIYMKVLGLNKGFLLYENKNNQQLLIIPVVWNPANTKLVDDTLAWMSDVYANWEAGTKPTRPFHSAKSLPCKSCPFKTHCWEVDKEDGVVTLPALEVPK
jgi:CRISPR/Cas system-associated exonuclease Cas4 (RecB family)